MECQLTLIVLHERLHLQEYGGAVSASKSFGAFMGYVAMGILLLLVFGAELLGGADELARVQNVAREHRTSLLTVVLVEGFTPSALDVLERLLVERKALVDAAPTDQARLAAL